MASTLLIGRWAQSGLLQQHLQRRSFNTSVRMRLADKVSNLPTSSPTALNKGDQYGDTSYSSPVMLTFGVFGRLFKVAVYGSVFIVVTTLAMWSFTHLYIEYVDFGRALPFVDPSETCGWEEDGWSAGHLGTGGTDPRLPFLARVAVRAAFAAQRYGGGPISTATRTESGAKAGGQFVAQQSEAIAVPDAGYLSAERYLLQAIDRASAAGLVLPDRAAFELYAKLASVRERMAGTTGLSNARQTYTELLESLQKMAPGDRWAAQQLAFIACKLGETSFRIARETLKAGPQQQLEYDSAEQHLLKAVQLSNKAESVNARLDYSTTLSTVHGRVLQEIETPSQRTLVGALASLCALYASTDQLAKASEIARATLNLRLERKEREDSFPRRLHNASIESKQALVSAYYGEIQRAQKVKEVDCLETLNSSIGHAKVASTAFTSDLGAVGTGQGLRIALLGSPTEKEAHRLVRESRSVDREARTAACLSSTLSGLIHELGRTDRKATWTRGDRDALQHYQNALAFAAAVDPRTDFYADVPKGEQVDGNGYRRAWNSLDRVRDRLQNKATV